MNIRERLGKELLFLDGGMEIIKSEYNMTEAEF